MPTPIEKGRRGSIPETSAGNVEISGLKPSDQLFVVAKRPASSSVRNLSVVKAR